MPISPDRILYQDDHLLAINKLSGELVVQGAKGKGSENKKPLYDFLKKDYPGLRVIHRLDFETSGVVLFAKSRAAEKKILDTKFDPSATLGAGQWKKKYRTLVMGRIDKKSGAVRVKLPARSQGLVPAETLYTVLDVFANSTYVECIITTGRYHQIRKHFAHIGHPLVLDREYGHPKFNQLFRQELGYAKFFLHAVSLEFPHPITNKPITVEAPLPKAFDECVRRLRNLNR